MEPRLLRIDELCERYNLKKRTVRTLCSQGRIPHIKIGRAVYFRVDAIEAWLKNHEKPAQEVAGG